MWGSLMCLANMTHILRYINTIKAFHIINMTSNEYMICEILMAIIDIEYADLIQFSFSYCYHYRFGIISI